MGGPGLGTNPLGKRCRGSRANGVLESGVRVCQHRSDAWSQAPALQVGDSAEGSVSLPRHHAWYLWTAFSLKAPLFLLSAAFVLSGPQILAHRMATRAT